ncbi:MAG: sulfatase-like hydrolase/transferase [Lachnospiraceae bacterium]|nr:sulfatase-like hydrolase/transferase [Lachnospiraceae bacterium]
MLDRNKSTGIIKHIAFYIIVPVILGLVIESLNRKSLIAGVEYMVGSPLLFCFNTLIILLTLSFALFFKREIFVFVSVSAVWLLFGIANFIILHFRVTPFSAVDFTLIKSAISVSGHYFSMLNIAMVVVALFLIAFCLACLYRKAPYHRHRNGKNIIISFVSVTVITIVIMFIKSSSSSVQALSTNYTNISEAYENYGFVYCFANSLIDTGIAKPENYSEEAVQSVTGRLEDKESTVSDNGKPNIIFIQLESFFDVDYVKGLKYKKDPLPVFHLLQENYTSGMLTVPTVGAGTVNTEFEVLTGIRQHDFGVCEYPYKTILKSVASESICHDLAKLGYKSHSVHNNDATFYGRNIVFSSLGFDTFTPVEYMNGITENDNGWANDDILVDEIIKTLNSTKGADFTFGITVQSHGKYDVATDKKYPLEISGAPEGMEEQYTYYVNQIAEVDQMIGDLIEKLSKRDEKTLLVLYGDHLPSLEISTDELENGDLYQTQYVTWNNYGLDKKDQDLTSYQLYPYILGQAGIHEGLITKYHQQSDWQAEGYTEGLTMLSYDLLYGENYAYNGINPFNNSDLKMGTDKISVTDVKKIPGITDGEETYLVTGTGFTPYAQVYFDGSHLDTEWIDSSHLKITESLDFEPDNEEEEKENITDEEDGENQEQTEDTDIDETDAFTIKILDDDGVILSTSQPLLYKETSLPVNNITDWY